MRPVSAVALFLAPVVVGVLILSLDAGIDPAPLPESFEWRTRAVAARNERLLLGSERLGEGRLAGPEDLAYDAHTRALYTGCSDGWIKRVALDESPPAVEDWVHIGGGRPLGVALAPDGALVVADAEKGLLRVKQDKTVEMLTNEAEGVPFRLTDGVDVARNGMIYFTDASYKHNLKEDMLDFLGGRPHGRLMSFDPSNNQTRVLLHGLYFANGVALSPNQDFLVFCESSLRRCRKYYIQGEKKGTTEDFADNLPGLPDNVRYDGEGHFWIALASGRTLPMYVIMKYPFVRKLILALSRYADVPFLASHGGVLGADVDGNLLALYTDPSLSFVSSGLKISNHLYYGFLNKPYISRLDLSKHPAT